ncbi:hypothetical protein Ddye_013296, partial [Dipteronia dyeriana]
MRQYRDPRREKNEHQQQEPKPVLRTKTVYRVKAPRIQTIVLPEQSVASEKAGLAVSKKGSTLKELLQQTSHRNAKVHKDSLLGIKDLFQRLSLDKGYCMLLSEMCLQNLLSIDLAIGFFVYGIGQGKPTLQGGPDGAIWDQTISSVLLKRLFNVFPLNATHNLSEKFDDRFFILNILIAEIFLQYSEWICLLAVLLEKFLEFIEDALVGKICSDTRSGRAVWGKHVLSMLPFIPKLLRQVASDWKFRLLQAFTMTFDDGSPKSSLKLACLSAIEEMLVPVSSILLTISLNLECSLHIVLHLLLRLGQRACMNSSFAREYDNIQYSLSKFYSSCQEG